MYVIIYFLLSHPTRGEWIEIWNNLWRKLIARCPIPHGMGGLKFGISERDKKLVASHLMRDSLKDVLK